MTPVQAARSASCAGLGLVLIGCAPALAPLPPIESLPPLPVQQVSPPPAAATPHVFPHLPHLEALGLGPPVTLSADNVDVRALIPLLAEMLGLSIVLGPEVVGRISLHVVDAPALEVLRIVLDELGMTLLGAASAPLWPRVVFYSVPVNIHNASPELIRVHFGVSQEVAEMATGRLPR